MKHKMDKWISQPSHYAFIAYSFSSECIRTCFCSTCEAIW